MSDTTSEMEQLKATTATLAEERHHTLGPFQEFAGGAVNIAECTKCQRFALAELYQSRQQNERGQVITSTHTDSRGSALSVDCETKKPK